MAREFLLGVDIGTYESKGVIATVDGRVVATQTCPHQLLIPRQGWAEHDPETMWWGDLVALARNLQKGRYRLTVSLVHPVNPATPLVRESAVLTVR